jgi:uncharacterized protein YjcR
MVLTTAGRKPMPQDTKDKIHELRASGMKIRDIAVQLGVSVGLVHGVANGR